MKTVAETGKAYVHDFLDVNKRPVLIVAASKHFPDVRFIISCCTVCPSCNVNVVSVSAASVGALKNLSVFINNPAIACFDCQDPPFQ